MTTETLTITQIIAEANQMQNKLYQLVGDKDFYTVQFYIKAKPFIGARSVDEVSKRIESDLDKVSDILVRYNAFNEARIKANANTMVKVPKMPTFADILAGKEVGEEEISIAEAINRKKVYKEVMRSLVANMKHRLVDSSRRKGQLEVEADRMIKDELDRQFPRDVQKNWSVETQKKAREDLEKKYAIERIDPKDTIKNDSVAYFENVVEDYINKIDTILSIANAKTEVTIEY